MINFDKAAQAPILPEVKEAIIEAMDQGYGNPSSVYNIGKLAKDKLEECRQKIADTINADPSEIIFTSGSTEVINWFARNYLHRSSRIEHHAIDRFHIDNEYSLKLNKNTYQIDLNQFKEQSTQGRYGASYMVSYVNNEIGVINPIKEMGAIKHSKSLLFVDGTQAYGHIPIDVKVDNMDFMCVSAQKFGGISGCGFLYKKNNDTNFPIPISRGGSQEHNFRAGTENLIGIIAMTKAAEICYDNLREKRRRVSEVRNYLYGDIIKKFKCAHLNGSTDWKYRYEGNLNFRFDGYKGEEIQSFLNDFDIFVSTGSACSSGDGEPSHVLKAIGLTDEEAGSSIRITFDWNNSIEEAESFILCLDHALKILNHV